MANEKLAREWMADLRGGKFKSARFALCQGDAYCPLGVLSLRIAADPGVLATGWSFDDHAWVKGEVRDPGGIPWDVWKAIGFADGSVPSAGYFSRHGDLGETFDTLAEYIELSLSGARVVDLPPAGRGERQ